MHVAFLNYNMIYGVLYSHSKLLRYTHYEEKTMSLLLN